MRELIKNNELKPERSNALVDLIDRIFVKGVILNADIIITVADIPLIGISLKAAIAGMRTMLDYGMMEAWDETLRREASKIEEDEQVALIEDEEIILKTYGEILSNFGTTYSDVWQPGYLYLTKKRLLLFRKKPPTILFETTLDKIKEITPRRMNHIGGVREVLSINLANGITRYLHSNGIIALRDAVERALGKRRLLVSPQRQRNLK